MFLPLSRAWAAALAAEGDLDRFAAALGRDAALLQRYRGALGRIAEQHLAGWPTQAAPDAQTLAAQRERALALGARE